VYSWPSKISTGLALAAALVAVSPASAQQLVFSTYLGGSLEEQARDVTVDSQGNVIVTGGTGSSDFPTTAGAIDRSFNGNYDVIVVKYDAAGNLLWSTYLGGPGYDRAYGVAVDGQDEIYIAGRASSGFPTTAGTLQPSFAGDSNPNPAYGAQDGFVCKLSAAGSLRFCTYFGDSSRSFLRDIDVDAAGNIYIAGGYGNTSSGSWPSSIGGAFLNGPRGGQDAVIAKLATDGTAVRWARYMGGSSWDSEENSVQLDGSGTPYLLFTTESTGIATAGAYDTTYAGQQDVFVTKLSTAGAVQWGSYVGGSQNESTETHELAVDATGEVYVAVPTQSPPGEFPSSGSTIRRSYGPGGGNNDVVVAKLSSDGSALRAIAFVGGGGADRPEGVAADATRGVMFTGTTTSSDFPVTPGAFQPGLRGRDALMVRLTPDLALDYATFLGGGADEYGRAAELGPGGSFYAVGSTLSTNWPTVNPQQPSFGGTADAFVVRFAAGSGCPEKDADGDGRIDGTELAWMGRAFGSCSADPALEWWYPVDYDLDGCVDGSDLVILVSPGVWGHTVQECVAP